MPLQSPYFAGNARLQSCLTSDASHVTPGAEGDFVGLIQRAIVHLDRTTIDRAELAAERYGPSTAGAVLAYKRKRGIINPSYQSSADNIVGKMTIAALDDELCRSGPKGARYVKPAGPLRPPGAGEMAAELLVRGRLARETLRPG